MMNRINGPVRRNADETHQPLLAGGQQSPAIQPDHSVSSQDVVPVAPQGHILPSLSLSAKTSLCGRLLHGSVRIDDELFRRALVEVLVTFRSVVQRDHIDVACFGDLHFVVQDGLH